MNTKKINESPMTYDGQERISPEIEKKISNPKSPLTKALGGIDITEKLASSRFKKVVSKLREITGLEKNLSNEFVLMSLINEMMSDINSIMMIESSNREALKKLALAAATKVTEVDPDWYIFSLKLNESFSINISEFKQTSKEIEIELNSENDLDRLDRLKIERDKRLIINAIIAGSAKKGNYAFEIPEVRKVLDHINPKLYHAYQKLMAVNDMLYFTMDDMIEMMSRTGAGVAGRSKIEGGEKTKIFAEGFLFPVLLHEIIKGIEESKALYGLPKDKEDRDLVTGETDIISNEPMDLRIGPEIIEKIRFSLPIEVFEPENSRLISFFQAELYSLPAKEFVTTIRKIVSDSEKDNKEGMRIINQIMEKAKKNFTDYKEFQRIKG